MARLHLQGVWLHDPRDPEATSWHFRFNGDGAKESGDVEAVLTKTVGRRRPVVDFGEAVTEALTVQIEVEDESKDLEALRRLVAARRTLCYRDTKGRKMYGVVRLGSVTDTFYGATTELTVEAVDDDRNDNL